MKVFVISIFYDVCVSLNKDKLPLFLKYNLFLKMYWIVSLWESRCPFSIILNEKKKNAFSAHSLSLSDSTSFPKYRKHP